MPFPISRAEWIFFLPISAKSRGVKKGEGGGGEFKKKLLFFWQPTLRGICTLRSLLSAIFTSLSSPLVRGQIARNGQAFARRDAQALFYCEGGEKTKKMWCQHLAYAGMRERDDSITTLKQFKMHEF